MTKRLLFIAFPFPPSRGAGVYRTVATVNFLASRGWEVTVVAPEEDYFLRYQGSEDRSLLDWPDPRAKIARVPLSNWYQEKNVARLSLFGAAFPAAADRMRRRVGRYVSPLEGYGFWFRPALQAGMRLVRSQRFDAILATGNPFNSFLVAHVISRRTGIPYVVDYRDAWTFDQFEGELKPGATDVALSLERRILHQAAGVTTVNDAILSWLINTHSLPGRVNRAVVENGYDSEFVGARVPGRSRAQGDPVRFIHIGTLVPGKMDWVGVLTEFASAAGQLEHSVTLDIWGHLGFSREQERQLSPIFEANPMISHNGPIERQHVADLYAEADVVWLPMYESPYVTSGKVYEIMATGKPILAWGPRSAGAMKPLAGYPKLVRASRVQPNNMTRALRAAVELSSIRSPELEAKTLRYAEDFERMRRLRPLGNLLDAVAG